MNDDFLCVERELNILVQSEHIYRICQIKDWCLSLQNKHIYNKTVLEECHSTR